MMKTMRFVNGQYRIIFLLVGLTIGILPVCLADSASTQLVGWAVGGVDDGYAAILYTTNGGNDWVRQGSAVEIANAELGCVTALDAQTAWAVGQNAWGCSSIYRTTNAGLTWCRQGNRDSVGTADLAKISACNRDVAWVSGDAGTVLRTTDGGLTWQDRSPAGYSNVYLQGITALDADIAWTAGHDENGYAPILRTTNGGLDWVSQYDGAVTNMAGILSIGAADALRLWAVGFASHPPNNGRVISTTNGGMTWKLQFDQSPGYHANELYVVNTAQVWVALDSSIIKTADGGRTWEKAGIRSTPYATMGICVPDGSNAWASSANWGGGFINHLPADAPDWIDQTPTNGIATMSYVSFVRQPDYASMGTLAITVIPSNGIWTLRSPPVGYVGPLCGTGTLAGIRVPAGNYNVSFTPLPGFATSSSQAVDVNPGQTSIVAGVYRSRQFGDYDGDGKTDVALYSGQSGDWIIYLSDRGYQYVTFNFGGAGLVPMAGDFDGDGRYDPCVVQTASGLWAVMLSGNGYNIEWACCGGGGYQPVRGDFDGDGKADLAVFEAANFRWQVLLSASGYGPVFFQFPETQSLTQPVSGDFDGDGKNDPAVYDTARGRWLALLSGKEYATAELYTRQPAAGNLMPVPADYDGDCQADPAVFNPDTGEWSVYLSGCAYTQETRFCGRADFLPVTGDFDGDDRADYSAYNAAAGQWISLFSMSDYTSGSALIGGASFAPVW